MENELMVTSPVETSNECYALVFDGDLNRKTLVNPRAVISIAKLTREQCIWASGEFRKRYTGTKSVDLVPERVLHAFFPSGIPKTALCCTVEELRKQNESPDFLKLIAETLNSLLHEIRGFREEGKKFHEKVEVLNERLQVVSENMTHDSKKKTADEKLRDFLESHPECRCWTSVDIGIQINESSGTVRKTASWKLLSQKRGVERKANQIRYKLNNERLNKDERDKLESDLVELNKLTMGRED